MFRFYNGSSLSANLVVIWRLSPPWIWSCTLDLSLARQTYNGLNRLGMWIFWYMSPKAGEGVIRPHGALVVLTRIGMWGTDRYVWGPFWLRWEPLGRRGGGPSSQGLLVVFPVYTFGDTLGIYMAIIGLGARRHGVSGWGGPFLVNMY